MCIRDSTHTLYPSLKTLSKPENPFYPCKLNICEVNEKDVNVTESCRIPLGVNTIQNQEQRPKQAIKTLVQIFVLWGFSPSSLFSSVQDGIYALGKVHKYMCSTPSLKSFPTVALENVCLIDDVPLSSFQGRSSSGSSFHASLLQAIDGLMCRPWLCTGR